MHFDRPTKSAWHYELWLFRPEPRGYGTGTRQGWRLNVWYKDGPDALQLEGWDLSSPAKVAGGIETLEQMETAHRTMKALWRAWMKATAGHNDWEYTGPLNIYDLSDALTKIAVHVQYDNRPGAYLPSEKILGPEWGTWLDYLQPSCVYGCVARNEQEARVELLKKMAANNYGNPQFVADWFAAGQPVRRSDYDRIPTFPEFPKRGTE